MLETVCVNCYYNNVLIRTPKIHHYQKLGSALKLNLDNRHETHLVILVTPGGNYDFTRVYNQKQGRNFY